MEPQDTPNPLRAQFELNSSLSSLTSFDSEDDGQLSVKAARGSLEGVEVEDDDEGMDLEDPGDDSDLPSAGLTGPASACRTQAPLTAPSPVNLFFFQPLPIPSNTPPEAVLQPGMVLLPLTSPPGPLTYPYSGPMQPMAPVGAPVPPFHMIPPQMEPQLVWIPVEPIWGPAPAAPGHTIPRPAMTPIGGD